MTASSAFRAPGNTTAHQQHGRLAAATARLAHAGAPTEQRRGDLSLIVTFRPRGPHPYAAVLGSIGTTRAALNAAVREGLLRDNPGPALRTPGASASASVAWTRSRVAAWQATGRYGYRPTGAQRAGLALFPTTYRSHDGTVSLTHQWSHRGGPGRPSPQD